MFFVKNFLPPSLLGLTLAAIRVPQKERELIGLKGPLRPMPPLTLSGHTDISLTRLRKYIYLLGERHGEPPRGCSWNHR